MMLYLSFIFSATIFTLASSASVHTIFNHRNHVSRDSSLFARPSSDVFVRDDCEPADPQNTVSDRLNTLLNTSGTGYVLPLCPSTQYYLTAPLQFFAPNQEISTAGYPTGDDRATLVVSGVNQTTAVDGQCQNCNGVILRNVQINGTRLGGSAMPGGANIEMGGSNRDQLIEYVHTFDPRGWSCLHIAEGVLNCTNTTVRNNDVGPCGSDAFQQWADGISMSCQNSFVQNNMVKNPTDGGVVLFGAPGTLVENNTIWVENNTLLGGINMVDYLPWLGNYTNTIVRNNTIIGGLATGRPTGNETDGVDDEDVIIKIGIAIGPRTWFVNTFFNNVSFSGTVLNNQLTGAFGYGMAMSSARNFTVENNILFGNTSFIGARGPNCTAGDTVPSPAPFVVDPNTTTQTTEQTNFQNIANGDGLTCIQPPEGGDYWPFGGNPDSPVPSSPASSSSGSTTTTSGLSGGAKAGIAIGVIFGVAAIAIVAFFIRRWALQRVVPPPQPWSTAYRQPQEK
ncbi:hypothetical protein B0H21DRAFT_215485 [Amylocystis lapponica]|nr:hypothetical protein B0H21DRAFT_215485 [Amylocystis lapponica]